MDEEVKSQSATEQFGAATENTPLVSVQSLKQRDERYFKWFHGKIPRNAAENLMQRNGDFLIRESLQNKEEYVLTCKYLSAYYNFKINKVKVPTSPTTAATMFSLEDRNFETLLDLVIFYALENVPVTKKTGVILSQPVNRTVALPFSEVPYASLKKGDRFGAADVTSCSNDIEQRKSKSAWIAVNEEISSRYVLILFNVLRNELIGVRINMRTNLASIELFELTSSRYSYVLLFKIGGVSTTIKQQQRLVPTNNNINNSNSNFSPSKNTTYDVPPKPSRAPSIKSARSPELSYAAGTQSNGSFVAANKNTNVSESQRSNSSGDNVRMRSRPFSPKKKKDNAATRRKRASCFKPAQYRCTLLSEENPPLEQRALSEMKSILLRTDSFKLARHMTVVDCKICHIMDDGMDHIFLPHATQLRQDILERYQCIAFWVVICVIKCPGGLGERTEMLNKLIQVANELVHSMGNVFGFSAVMHGLNSPQIQSMDSAWRKLELTYTNNSVTFRKKLRPLLLQLDQGKDQIRMATTCIPHILPLVRLLEHQLAGVPDTGAFDSPITNISPTASPTESSHLETRNESKFHWWENIPDESFDSLLHHLHYGRSVVESATEFKKTANSRLIDFEETVVVREMFTTDFQMRLLFGFRSSESPQKERFNKFDQILTALLRLITD